MDHQPEQREPGSTVPERGQDRSGKEQVAFVLRLALVLGMAGAYAVAFSPLYRLTDSGMWAALAILPVIAAAWFWGLRSALLAALLCSLLSGLLVSLVQLSHRGVVGQALLVSLAAYFPAGAVVGRLHDLGERLRDQIAERKRAEDALRESEVKWRTLALTAPAVILTIDRDGIIQYLNRAVGEYTPEQAVGTSAYDYVSPDQRETMRRSIEQVLETGQPGSYEILGAGPQGPGTAWYETRLGPVLYNDQVTAVTLVSTDITERKRAEEALRESEEKYRNVVERANDGIVIIQEAIVRYANPRLAEMWGATLQELIGTPFADHVHPDELPKVVDRYKRRMAGEDVTPIYETVLSRNDGTKLYAELNAGIITYQGNPADLVIVRDTTDRKRAEEQLHRYAAELERANQELRDFTYIVSHDLRAPLINLKGFTGELRQACVVIRDVMKIASPYLGEEQRQALTTTLQEYVPEALEFIDASTTRMDQLIRALLKLSRVGRRDLNLTPIDMDALVEETLQTLAHQIEEGQVQVTVGPLPQVVADRTSMEQIMGNLLSNAVNYLDRDRPGEIEISGERGREETTFRVRDNGRGIAKDDMDKVFAPFRRAGRQDRPGEGMGLAYVQALVRRHGGRIWCESELAAGTTFTFTISDHLEKGGDHE